MNAKTSPLSLVALFSLVVACFGTGCSASTVHARATSVDLHEESAVALDRVTAKNLAYARSYAVRR